MSSAQPALAARGVWLSSSVATLAALGLSCVVIPAGATDYQLNPRLELAAGYDDNANLAVTGGNKIGASDGLADVRVDLVASESNWQWRLTPEMRGTWYPSHSELDSNGEFLNLSGLRTGERYTLGLDGYGSSQSLLANYLPTANIAAGLGVAEPGTTLVIPGSIRQNLGYLNPSYTLAMTQRSSLDVSVGYTDATYSQQVQGGYVNYQNVTGSAGLVYAVSLTGALTVRAVGQDFRPDLGPTSNTYGAELQWDGKFSATEQYYLRLGVGRTDFSGPLAGVSDVSSSTNWSGGAGTNWTYQVTEIFVDATRGVAPTAQGYAVNQDQLRLRLARRFTPRFAGFVGVRAIYEDPLRAGIAPTARVQHYNYATAGFEWRVQQYFSVISGYDFTDYRYGGPSGQANAVHVSFVYEPHRPAEGPAITIGY
jgi:hypothetical protein